MSGRTVGGVCSMKAVEREVEELVGGSRDNWVREGVVV